MPDTKLNCNCIIVHTSINTLYLLNDVLKYWPTYLHDISFIIYLNDGEETFLYNELNKITEKNLWLSSKKITQKESLEKGVIYFSGKKNGSLIVQNELIEEKENLDTQDQVFVQLFLCSNVNTANSIIGLNHQFNIALKEKTIIPQQSLVKIDLHLDSWQIADYIVRFITHWSFLKQYQHNENEWQQAISLILNNLGEKK